MADRREDAWSVASLMKICVYSAVNFSFFHAIGPPVPFWFVFLLLTILNLLFFGFSRWNRDRADRKFWNWFEMTGWGMIGLSVAFAPETMPLIVIPTYWLLDHARLRRDGSLASLLFLAGATILYGIVPLAAAAFAGRLASRSDSTEPETSARLDS